jgi:hypothetical protein
VKFFRLKENTRKKLGSSGRNKKHQKWEIKGQKGRASKCGGHIKSHGEV